MRIWIVGMECAGIAEAGGVKNVVYALCREFHSLGHEVTLFIPEFGCTDRTGVEFTGDARSAAVSLCGREETVTFHKARSVRGGFGVVLVGHRAFSEKEGVYTYTESEQERNPSHVRGTGHTDMLFMDTLFQKAVCVWRTSGLCGGGIPDIIHCQDASTAVLPAYMMRSGMFPRTVCAVTVHNAGPAYHHNFRDTDEADWYTGLGREFISRTLNSGRPEPFLMALNSGAALTTVSEEYADELTDPGNSAETDGLSVIFHERGTKIKGITNGIDFSLYDPEDTGISLLPYSFSPERGELDGKYRCREFLLSGLLHCGKGGLIPGNIRQYGYISPSDGGAEVFAAYHGRITAQKGIDVLLRSVPALAENFPGLRFVIAGQGEAALEERIVRMTEELPGRIVFLNGYDRAVARLSAAACDLIILPSLFEPCGLEDFIAQIYGTIPVAHKTGGLNKILDRRTGFLYRDNTELSLTAKLSEAVSMVIYGSAAKRRMIRTAARYVHRNFRWSQVASKKYIPFFREILRNRTSRD